MFANSIQKFMQTNICYNRKIKILAEDNLFQMRTSAMACLVFKNKNILLNDIKCHCFLAAANESYPCSSSD